MANFKSLWVELEHMNFPNPPRRLRFAAGEYEAVELAEEDLPALQAFFVANPEYFLAVTGALPRPDEAKQELEFRPPPGLPYEKVYVLGFLDSSRQMAAMASVFTGLLAPRVWHISLFIVATALHGTGTAGLLYERLENWAKDEGASWLRLGAAVGNVRAERFWDKAGYREFRRMKEQQGRMTNTMRVMVKSLGGSGVDDYLREVPRDRPEPSPNVG
jgi:GNAT superfamily N-acetyltransferase